MFCELSIKNFAIIDDLRISFPDGLTVFSGETGAGKSIIINAVNLLLGSRASARLIRTGEDAAELEAVFSIVPESKVAKIMEDQGYDPAEGLLVRRIISRNDRHRIYINGCLATIQILNSITENLASISGQHAHQGLLKEESHLLVLDQFGGLMPLRSEVCRCYHEIAPLIRKQKELMALQNYQVEHIEFLKFQKKEIEAAAITPEEDTGLEKERLRLKNGEALYQTVYNSIEALYSREGAVIEQLTEIKKDLERALEIDPELLPGVERLSDATFQIEDISEGLRNYLQNIQIDERRLEEVEARLDVLQKLKRKYGGSLEAVLLYLESIQSELSGTKNLAETIAANEEKLSRLHDKIVGLAEHLSMKRKQSAESIAGKVEKELATLKMSKTKFEVSLQEILAGDDADPLLATEGKAISETGIDRAVFMIAPNVGEALKPLANVASGGELSRVVLSLKAIMAQAESVETLVFDEVDAGIGGAVAEVVGRKLASLARYHQVVCITHLPQIAKFGSHHFKISKHVAGNRTRTIIEPLSGKERISEIARMLGGVEITAATLDHAREMMAEK